MGADRHRLKAMQALGEDKALDTDHPVPCQIRTEDVEPAELSLAENVIRIAMHPADQVAAFTKLAEAGQSVSAMASRFGASERIVEQRLRLGNAAPELLNAYRAGEIDLEVLNTFTVTADRALQVAGREQVSRQGCRPAAWQVKRMLAEECGPGMSAVARFVGMDAYEAAGGTVMRDLFADEYEHRVWFEYPVLLEKLALAKLQATDDEMAARWKWAVPMIEVAGGGGGGGDTAHYSRIEPRPGALADEERAGTAKLEAKQAEIAGLDDGEWTAELVCEADPVEARAVFRREDFAMAGCIVTVGHDGAMQVIRGLVKPEGMPKPVAIWVDITARVERSCLFAPCPVMVADWPVALVFSKQPDQADSCRW